MVFYVFKWFRLSGTTETLLMIDTEPYFLKIRIRQKKIFKKHVTPKVVRNTRFLKTDRKLYIYNTYIKACSQT